jgi:hypothetical protein
MEMIDSVLVNESVQMEIFIVSQYPISNEMSIIK